MPFCVRSYLLRDGNGAVLASVPDNHQTRNVIRLAAPVTTRRLVLECLATHGAPAAVFKVACFAP
jgi:hypothetical protein